MSVQSQIDRIEQNVASTYNALESVGADMPETRNSNNLPETVISIKAVRYDEQILTEEQKSQARENIDAAGVHVGSTAPTDDHIQFWVNPDETPNDIDVYSKKETEALVTNAINAAIGNAIGGSY